MTDQTHSISAPNGHHVAGDAAAHLPDRAACIAAGFAAVQRRVDTACQRCNRDPVDVRILPVTKYHQATDIGILRNLGVTEVAENRHPQGQQRADAYPGIGIAMIGRIQTNKANAIARWASSVHSVDSERLAHALNRGVSIARDRGQREHPLNVFVQLSADGDQNRGGAGAADVLAIADEITANCPHLRLAGVMAMAPLTGDPGAFFRHAQDIRSRLEDHLAIPLDLSAGMSGDLDEAVSAGSTIVRVGTAILGPRVLG